MQGLRFLLLFVFKLCLAQELQCKIPGECSGNFVGINEATTYNDCLDTCKSNTNCNWFTFYSNLQECLQFYDCPEIENTCSDDCFSGQVDCKPDEPICNQTGFCDGNLVIFNFTDTFQDCLKVCKTLDECKWYSYFPDSKSCILTEDCLFIDTSCADCVHGEKECAIAEETHGKLMVVGGYGAEYKVELINLENPSQICPPLSDIPLERDSFGTYIAEKAIVCDFSCYSYNNNNNTWDRATSMNQGRIYAAGVNISPTQWWVSGGDYGAPTSTSEIYYGDQNRFYPYVDLPVDLYMHVMLKVNTSHIMVLGGSVSTAGSWLFNLETELWSPLPDMQEVRQRPQGGLVRYPDGHVEVVVAGGLRSMTSELFSFATNSWRNGPNLPRPISEGGSVQYGSTFLLVGGRDNGTQEALDTIFEFDVENDEWILKRQTLQFPRFWHAAFLVPNDYITC